MLKSTSEIVVFLLLMFYVSLSRYYFSSHFLIVMFSQFLLHLNVVISLDQSLYLNILLSSNLLKNWSFYVDSNIYLDNFFYWNLHISCDYVLDVFLENGINIYRIIYQSFDCLYVLNLSV